MRKFLTVISFLLLVSSTHSQQLSQVTFSRDINLDYISVLTDQAVLMRINADGKLIEWGMEALSNRANYYAPRLQPFMGRVEYYGPESDSIFRGKLKSIGAYTLTYYDSYEADAKPGKIKSVGSLSFDYYTSFDNKAFQGKLKSAGNMVLTYYSSTDDEAFRGKLKSVGNSPVSYYSTFDDKLIQGKIKSIGSVAYEWYGSFDRSELKGSLKSGLYRQIIGGITYIIR